MEGGGVRVTAPPVIEKKKGLLGKKQETLSPYDVVTLKHIPDQATITNVAAEFSKLPITIIPKGSKHQATGIGWTKPQGL